MSLTKISEGKLGEDIAVTYLKKHGYQIIDRNFRIRGGEIDIIAREKDVLVFVEVKTRRSHEFGTPFEAITYWKIKSLVKAAQFYKVQHPHLPDAMRIDAVGIFLEHGKKAKVELVKNINS